MAREFALAFYKSKAWVQCRIGYMLSQNYICERCGDTAKICHHKEHLTPANINDPYITLNWDNLESVCQECHNLEHHKTKATVTGTVFDSNGNLVKINK